MNYLVDTHIFLYLLFQPKKIKKGAHQILLNKTANKCFISAISLWEISLKYSLGKLHLNQIMPDQLPQLALEMGFDIIDLNYEEAATYNQLEAKYHKDPFDRMLIWQAVQHNYTLITNDTAIHKYKSIGLKVLS